MPLMYALRYGMYMVPHSMPAPRAARIPSVARPGAAPEWCSVAYGQQARARHNRRGAAEHLGPLARAGTAQFVEQQPAPEQSHQAVDVPQRERDRQSHVANREDRQRVGDGPQHTRQNGPHDQVRLLLQVQPHIAGALERHGHRPTGDEHASHHSQRDDEGRKTHRHQLGGSLGPAQPRTGGQAAGHAQAVQRTGGPGSLRRLAHGFTSTPTAAQSPPPIRSRGPRSACPSRWRVTSNVFHGPASGGLKRYSAAARRQNPGPGKGLRLDAAATPMRGSAGQPGLPAHRVRPGCLIAPGTVTTACGVRRKNGTVSDSARRGTSSTCWNAPS